MIKLFHKLVAKHTFTISALIFTWADLGVNGNLEDRSSDDSATTIRSKIHKILSNFLNHARNLIFLPQ